MSKPLFAVLDMYINQSAAACAFHRETRTYLPIAFRLSCISCSNILYIQNHVPSKLRRYRHVCPRLVNSSDWRLLRTPFNVEVRWHNSEGPQLRFQRTAFQYIRIACLIRGRWQGRIDSRWRSV